MLLSAVLNVSLLSFFVKPDMDFHVKSNKSAGERGEGKGPGREFFLFEEMLEKVCICGEKAV